MQKKNSTLQYFSSLNLTILATYSQCFSQGKIGEKDVCLKDVAHLTTDPLAHAMAVQSDGARGYLSVAG